MEKRKGMRMREKGERKKDTSGSWGKSSETEEEQQV